MVEVYVEKLSRKHVADIVSAAVLVRIFLLLAGLGLALVVSFATGGFWEKLRTQLAQAEVHYTGDALLLFEGAEPGDEMIWSTSPIINAEFAEYSLPAQVQTAEDDTNYDGKPDVITFIASVQSRVPIHSVKALLQFKYKLDDTAELEMFSLAYLSASSAAPAGGLVVDGDLVLEQRTPLTAFQKNDMYSLPLLYSYRPVVQQAAQPGSSLLFESIIGQYLSRNYTTFYTNDFPVWMSGKDNFELVIRVRIPPNQVIWVRPQIIEMLKFAWIQYLATLMVIWRLYSWVEAFIFRYRMLPTRLVSDMQPRLQKF